MDITKFNILQYTIEKNYLSDQLKSLYNDYLFDFEYSFGNEKKKYKDLKKTYIVDLLARIFADKDLFLRFLNLFPLKIRTLFEFLTFQNVIFSAESLEEKFRIKILSDRNNGYVNSTASYFEPLLYLFSFKTEYGNNKQLYLAKDIANIVKEYFKLSDNYKLIEAVKEPETSYIYIDQGKIISHLTLYIKSVENIKSYTKGKKILKGTKKSVYEQCDINEFYPDSLTEDWSFIKTELIINFIKSTNNNINLNNIDILKNLFEQYKLGDSFFSYQLLYHIKNLSRYTNEEYFNNEHKILNSIFNTNIITLIKKLPLNKWIDIKNFYNAYVLDGKGLQILVSNAMGSIYYDDDTNYSYNEKEYINSENSEVYLKAILEPLIKATMFLFAAFGLLDIAYNKPENIIRQKSKNYLSIFDGLEYIKLNDLGAYVLGISKNYQVKITQEDIEIKLSDSDLKIFVKGQSRAKTMFLESFAQKLSESFYKVDYSTFLKGCLNKRDIKNKIELFKKEVSDQLPEIWINFFKDILSRGESLDKSEKFILYKFKEKNRLSELFLKDTILKRYSLKVEKMMIAIKKEDINKVQKRLESLGYLGSII